MAEDEFGRGIGQFINGVVEDTVVRPIAEHKAHPLPEKNHKRAVWGTGLLTAGVYAACCQLLTSPHSASALIGDYVRALAAPLEDSWPYYAWAAAMLFGLLWLTVGLRGARAPREAMKTFWALVRVGFASAALWYGFKLGIDATVNPWVPGLCITLFAMSVMSLYLALRGPGRGAVQLVQQQIARQQRTFRIGRRRVF